MSKQSDLLHQSLYLLRQFSHEAQSEIPKVRLSFQSPRDKAHFERWMMLNMRPDEMNPHNSPRRGRYQLVGVNLVLLVEDR